MWSNTSTLKAQATSSIQPIKDGLESESDHPHHQTKVLQSSPIRNGSPLMRYKHAVCSSPSGHIYIHGGRFGNSPLDDDVWRFDPHHNSWLQLETSGCKPPCLQEHTLIEYNECLYLFGGQVSASNQENTFWLLDLSTRQWQSLNMKSSKFGAHLGPTNRRGHSAVIYKDSMYIFGGFEDFRGSSSQLWQYNFNDMSWELRNLNSTSACNPEARHSHSAIVYDDSMFIFGGLSNLKPLSDLWRWSWRDRRWFRERTRGSSPGHLHGHTAIQAFGSMFVFGGERNGKTTRSLWRLNLSNMCWQKIRPKGPRPDPTTWHAAIANPLDILDETNYIIEGDCEQLLHQSACSSLCDNCFPSENAKLECQTSVEEPLRSLVRVDPINVHSSISGSSLDKTVSNQRASIQKSVSNILIRNRSSTCLATKRRLRLKFLRKNKSRELTSKSAYELRKLDFQNRSLASNAISEVNSIATSHTNKQPILANNLHERVLVKEIVEKKLVNDMVTQDGTQILDTLDSDIKQMFHQAMVPSDGSINCDSSRMSVDSCRHDDAHIPRDCSSNSQLNSFMSKSQTYQTANDQLSGVSSTLTLTANNVINSDCNRGNPIRQRSSQPPLMRAVGSKRHADRPRSEIVQSLIDRADARIKHLYTPFFNLDHQHGKGQLTGELSFKVNDPVLGRLQNHRMFDKVSNSTQCGESISKPRHSIIHTSQDNANQRLGLDRSKRHTIHQTMTYYNLYFSEEKSSFGSPSHSINSGNENEIPSGHGDQIQSVFESSISTSLANKSSQCETSTLNRDELSSSTIKGMCSTSAALIGVRDGSSNGSQVDQLSSKDNTIQNLSSESKTIGPDAGLNCANSHNNYNYTDPSLNTLEDRRRRGEQPNLNSPLREAASDNGDNTSLSFSVIGEFEEDDMLQYSSPTDPIVGERIDHLNGDDEFRMQIDDDQMCSPLKVRNGLSEQLQSRQIGSTIGFKDQKPHLGNTEYKRHTLGDQPQMPHNSASSGYDSIHSSQNSEREANRQQCSLDAHEDNSSRTGSPINDRNDSLRNKSILLRQTTAADRAQILGCNDIASANAVTLLPTTTTTSSTTADSLALTSTSEVINSSTCPPLNEDGHQAYESKSLPTSPADKKLIPKASQSCKESLPHSCTHQHPKLDANTSKLPLVNRSAKFFRKKKSKVRYWQLCMFVIGGKLDSTNGINEPITVWRLYI